MNSFLAAYLSGSLCGLGIYLNSGIFKKKDFDFLDKAVICFFSLLLSWVFVGLTLGSTQRKIFDE